MDTTRGASEPCQLGDEAETRRDVLRWRKAERAGLIAQRQAMAVSARQAADAVIADDLVGDCGTVIGLYWPFRGEPDLRGWAAAMRDKGAKIALPVVIEKGRPLEFRLWSPDSRLTRGVWDIPIPAEGAPVLTPDLIIAPVVGADAAHFRLGYGGGFYDRTLAAMRAAGRRPWVIGVGYAFQSLPTIFPLGHDIAMDRVILA